MNKTVKDLILVVLGSFIFAAGVNAFIISGNLGEGGVTGLAIILYYAFHISPAITNFLVNAVLIAIGYKFLSKRSMYLTILVTILISIFLSLTESWQVETGNSIVNAIFGGVSGWTRNRSNYPCRRYNSRYNNFGENCNEIPRCKHAICFAFLRYDRCCNFTYSYST